ncbi:NUMOD3 domain-containing DNA-binding protein, partial [Staphylococcus aureus]
IAKNGNPFLGKTHSSETKRKISDKLKLAQSGSKNSQFGTMWINNGIEAKKISKDSPIPEGWYKGRKLINK